MFIFPIQAIIQLENSSWKSPKNWSSENEYYNTKQPQIPLGPSADKSYSLWSKATKGFVHKPPQLNILPLIELLFAEKLLARIFLFCRIWYHGYIKGLPPPFCIRSINFIAVQLSMWCVSPHLAQLLLLQNLMGFASWNQTTCWK